MKISNMKLTNKHRFLCSLSALLLASMLIAQKNRVGLQLDPPTVPLEECKMRLLQSFDSDIYHSFAKYGDTEQNMYYYIYVATNFSYNTTLLYYPASDVARMYHHRLLQMDSLSAKVYFELLQEGCKHNEPWCLRDLAQLYGMVYHDTITALDYYQRYMELEVPKEKRQRSTEIFLQYIIHPTLSCQGRIVQPTNKFKPDSPDDWRYRIFWDGDINAYNKLIDWARKSSNEFDFYECLYYSLVMTCKFVYDPAKSDLREILGTMLTDNTPEDALAHRLLRLFE